ncbi:MAG: alpha/beta hydrolase [Chloroflexi bacterium]|nr:alpha/beta hydrolase [Chloroflexota bacterium]
MTRVVLAVLLMLSMTLLPQAQETLPVPDEGGVYLTIEGVRVYAIDRGDPDSPAVLLLHGFGGSVVTWRYTMDPLVEAGYRVVAFDRPPYGFADKRIDITWDDAFYRDLTISVMDELGIDRAVLVGHSAGGSVVANVGIAYPERVAGLVFAAGAVFTRQAAEAMGSPAGDSPLAGLASGISAIDPESPLAQLAVRAVFTPERFADILFSTYYDPDKIPADAVEVYGRTFELPGWEAAFLKLLTQGMPDMETDDTALANLEMPILLIWGEDDTWVPLTVGESLADVLADAELITYPETGHIPMEEQSEAFNKDLLDFLVHVYNR